jgi:hypothetical protein
MGSFGTAFSLTGELISANLSIPSFEASVAQSVERLIRNQQVGGSIPLAGFFQIRIR